MAEENDRGSSDRQATWVALRTLRQRPTPAGRTEEGAAVYEIRSVRLVLTSGAAHFRRLVTCAKCGREVPGSSVLAPADLDRPANPVFCERCVRSPVPPRPDVTREREEPPAPDPPPAPPVVAEGAVGVGRLGGVEAQLAEVLSREPSPVENAGELQRLSEQVADLVRGQDAELAKMAASVAEVRAEMRELTAQVATQLRVEIGESIDLLRAELASLEQRSRDELEAVAALMEAQRKDLTGALHDVAHETLMSVAEPLRDLTKAREELERRLESLQQKVQEDQRRVEALDASADAGASRLHALEQKLHTSVQRLIHPVGANPDEREVGPARRVEHRPAGALLESLERQLREAEERLGQL